MVVGLSKQRKGELIPLLEVLRSLKSSDRIIILAHLDEETRDALSSTIASVLKSEKVPVETRLGLQKKLHRHGDSLSCVVDHAASGKERRRTLSQLGGGPMKVLLNAALPLLLDLFPK